MNNNIIGYMQGRTGVKHTISVLVTIEIPIDAITNLHREDIIDSLNATYTTNKVKIIKIIDEKLNEYSICTIDYVNDCNVNDILHGNNYYMFFLTKKRAVVDICDYNYRKHKSYNGHIVNYYDNGQIDEEYRTNGKGKKHGNYKCWTKTGLLLVDANYFNGKLNGEYKKYQGVDENGNLLLKKHLFYSNDKVTKIF